MSFESVSVGAEDNKFENEENLGLWCQREVSSKLVWFLLQLTMRLMRTETEPNRKCVIKLKFSDIRG